MIEALASQNPARGGMFIERSSRPNIFFLFFSTHGRFAVIAWTRNKTEKLAPKSVFSVFRKHRFLSDLRSLFLESGAAAPARFIPMDAGAYNLANKTAPLKNKKKELSSGFVPSINMPPLAGF